MSAPAPSLAFPRSARLLDPPAFKAVFEGGQRVGDRYFRLNVLPRDAGEARIGLAVSRRADRSAVVRNRIKRIARDVFRRARPDLPAADYVLIAHAAAAQAVRAGEDAALHQSLRRLLERSLSLKPPAPTGKMPDSTPEPPASPPDAPSS